MWTQATLGSMASLDKFSGFCPMADCIHRTQMWWGLSFSFFIFLLFVFFPQMCFLCISYFTDITAGGTSA